MTRDEAKALLPIIQAYAEGKTIQTKKIKTDSTGLNEKWIDCINPDFDRPSCYRVKPDPKCRPFRNAEECWQEMQKHQPFGWLRVDDEKYIPVGIVRDDGFSIIGDNYYHYGEDFGDCTFADGAPFGIMED